MKVVKCGCKWCRCGLVTCQQPAEVMVHWPGQPSAMCAECAERARRVAEVLGYPLMVLDLDLYMAQVQRSEAALKKIREAADAAARLKGDG